MPHTLKVIGLDDQQIKNHAGLYGKLAIILGLVLMLAVVAAYYYLGQKIELITLIMEAHARTLSELQPIRSETLAAAQAMKAVAGILTTAFHCAILFSGLGALLMIHEGMLYRKVNKLLKRENI
jgi:uncharacterized membrane protein SpoIIM required for sporulation